jgi:hypothetical protein
LNGPKSREETPKEGDAIRVGAHTALREIAVRCTKFNVPPELKPKQD